MTHPNTPNPLPLTETEFEIIADVTAGILTAFDSPVVLTKLHQNAASEEMQILVGSFVKRAVDRATALAKVDVESEKNWIRAQRDTAEEKLAESAQTIAALRGEVERLCEDKQGLLDVIAEMHRLAYSVRSTSNSNLFGIEELAIRVEKIEAAKSDRKPEGEK